MRLGAPEKNSEKYKTENYVACPYVEKRQKLLNDFKAKKVTTKFSKVLKNTNLHQET